MKDSKNYNRSVVFSMCVTAFIIALSVLFKFISAQLKIFSEFGFDLEYVILIMGIIMLPNYKYRTFAMIFSTGLWMMVSPPVVINGLQVFVEYILVVLVYVPFLFLDVYRTDNKIKKYVIAPILLIACTIAKLFIHVIAGVVWWVPGNWLGSFLINAKIVLGNLLINIFVMISMLKSCLDIKSVYYTKPIKVKAKPVYI